VFEQYRIATYREASFRLFVIAAMIFLTRVKNYPALLKNLRRRELPQMIQRKDAKPQRFNR